MHNNSNNEDKMLIKAIAKYNFIGRNNDEVLLKKIILLKINKLEKNCPFYWDTL